MRSVRAAVHPEDWSDISMVLLVEKLDLTLITTIQEHYTHHVNRPEPKATHQGWLISGT